MKRKFLFLAGVTVTAMAVVGAFAGSAAADTPSKSYCSKGGTFTTSVSFQQSLLDAGVAAGGIWNVEFDGTAFGVNEPSEGLAELFAGSDGGDDFAFFSDPTGKVFGSPFPNQPVPASAVEFMPVFAGPCVTPPAPPPGASHVFLCNKAYPSDANMILAAV